MTTTPLRLTILTANYAPETNAAARRLTAAAEHFRDAGWQVTVITPAPHHPENRVMDGYGGSWRRTTIEDGIRLIRFAPLIVPPGNLALRLVAESTFAATTFFQAVATQPDVVLATSPYMFLGPVGLLASSFTRATFAWDVRDLTWKYVRATGRRTFGLDLVLNRIMLYTAHRAHALTTATYGQMEELHQAGKPGRAVITNGMTASFIEQLQRGEPSMSEGHFTVTYAGLLGYPQGLDTLLDAASRLPQVRFLVAGDGPERGRLEFLMKRMALENVEFKGHLGLDELSALYASSDVLVAMLRGGPEFKVAQPSKVWEYMATGKPVVFAGDCEATRIIEQQGIGVVVPPEDGEALSKALFALQGNSELRAQLGRQGLEFVRAERDRTKILARWEQLLRSSR